MHVMPGNLRYVAAAIKSSWASCSTTGGGGPHSRNSTNLISHCTWRGRGINN